MAGVLAGGVSKSEQQQRGVQTQTGDSSAELSLRDTQTELLGYLGGTEQSNVKTIVGNISN